MRYSVFFLFVVATSLNSFSWWPFSWKTRAADPYEECVKAQLQSPYDPMVNYNLGVLANKKGDTSLALASFDRVIKEEQRAGRELYSKAATNSGHVMAKMATNVLEGLQWREKKIAKDVLSEQLGRIDSAIDFYNLVDDDFDPEQNLSGLKQQLQDFKQAVIERQKELEKQEKEKKNQQQPPQDNKNNQNQDQNQDNKQDEQNQSQDNSSCDNSSRGSDEQKNQNQDGSQNQPQQKKSQDSQSNDQQKQKEQDKQQESDAGNKEREQRGADQEQQQQSSAQEQQQSEENEQSSQNQNETQQAQEQKDAQDQNQQEQNDSGAKDAEQQQPQELEENGVASEPQIPEDAEERSLGKEEVLDRATGEQQKDEQAKTPLQTAQHQQAAMQQAAAQAGEEYAVGDQSEEDQFVTWNDDNANESQAEKMARVLLQRLEKHEDAIHKKRLAYRTRYSAQSESSGQKNW